MQEADWIKYPGIPQLHALRPSMEEIVKKEQLGER